MELNPVSIAKALVGLVQKDYPDFEDDLTPTDKELEVSKDLLKTLYTVLTDAVFEEENLLEVLPDSEGSAYSQNSNFDDDGNLLDEKVTTDNICPIERKIEILRLWSLHPNWGLASIQSKGGKELKHMCYKKLWADQISRGGTIFEKYKFIDKEVFNRFCEARKSFKFVNDNQLKLWGLQAAQKFSDNSFGFKASATWILKFKEKHGITSRKVTKLVSKRDLKSMDQILEASGVFQKKFKEIALKYDSSNVLNTDQTGFNYELARKRTLSFKGERDTLGMVKSPKNLVTHSYTIQYTISMSGEIFGDVFLCFQERSGRLGPKVSQDLFPAENVCITCSVSGKLTTSLFEYYLDKVLVPNVKENFLLLVDSWSGQTNPLSYLGRFGGSKPVCDLQIVPKKCTSLCQPLDTTFHLQLKTFANLIYDEARLKYSDNLNPADEITTRNNIIRTQSLIHNQFKSPLFREMIRYSWYSAKLTDQREPIFFRVKDVCFYFEQKESILCECGKIRFIKCSHCRKILCFDCFFYEYHFHRN